MSYTRVAARAGGRNHQPEVRRWWGADGGEQRGSYRGWASPWVAVEAVIGRTPDTFALAAYGALIVAHVALEAAGVDADAQMRAPRLGMPRRTTRATPAPPCSTEGDGFRV